ncbi:MAG: tetratricopeptide repeat protein [Bdellovibrionota bacterium]
MKFHGFCPRCSTELTQLDHQAGFAICKCGWYDDESTHHASEKSEKKTMTVLAGAAVALVLGYGHLISWGSYAVHIPIVKIQQITGTLSPAGYNELAENCIVLNKWSCAKDAFVDLYHKTSDPSALAKLASLQSRLGDMPSAIATYQEYHRIGGKDGDALLKFGRLLDEAGQAQQAFTILEESIAARPEILPVQATGSIVRMLMKQGRFEEAHRRLVEFRKSAGNAAGYLNTEFAEVTAARSMRKASRGKTS